jgi:hypothetical protein
MQLRGTCKDKDEDTTPKYCSRVATHSIAQNAIEWATLHVPKPETRTQNSKPETPNTKLQTKL